MALNSTASQTYSMHVAMLYKTDKVTKALWKFKTTVKTKAWKIVLPSYIFNVTPTAGKTKTREKCSFV